MTVLRNDKKCMIPSKSSEWLEKYHTDLEWDACPPKLNTSDIDTAMEKMFSYHVDYDDDDQMIILTTTTTNMTMMNKSHISNSIHI